MGLKDKDFRKETGKKPTNYCTNCKCTRYAPCYCLIKEGKKKGKE